jgi:protein O-mannosyl-transferase
MKSKRKVGSRVGSTDGRVPTFVRANPAHGATRTSFFHVLLLLAVTAGFYAGALRDGFVTDDTAQLLKNPFITSYRNIPRLFATNVWAFANSGTSNFYRPLQMLVYMAEYYSFGFHPLLFHLVNLLAGFAGVIAAYFLIRGLSGRGDLALLAALLFALHPVHVEPMVWISALPDLLCGFFLFTATLFYHRAVTHSRPLLNHTLATAAYLAALFCKETALVFPGLLIAYELLYRRESIRTLFSYSTARRLAPYLGAWVIYLVFRVRALGSFEPVSSVTPRVTPWQNFFSVPVLVVQYALKLIWPTKLNYYHHFIPQNGPSWEFFASVLLVSALVVATFLLRKSQPLLSFALAWFFITLIPALSINSVSDMVFAERYLFVPSFGFCIIAAWVVLRLTKQALPTLVVRSAYATFALTLLLYAVLIESRVPQWQDDVSLFQSAALLSPRLPIVQLALGASYYREGRPDMAVVPIERSVALGFHGYEPQLYLALALGSLGRDAEAMSHLTEAYQLRTPSGLEWSAFGLAHAGLRQWAQAADCYRRAAEAEPHNQLMFELLGEALQEKGDLPGATMAWQRALSLQPGYLDASINLAVALAQTGDTDDAVAMLTAAIQANPSEQHLADAYVNLGTVYVHRGDLNAAEAAYQNALSINPDLTFARRSIDMIEVRRHSQP